MDIGTKLILVDTAGSYSPVKIESEVSVNRFLFSIDRFAKIGMCINKKTFRDILIPSEGI